jgi:hypothetical protein
MKHPNGSLQNILNFLWCLWKSRNDSLFNRKQGQPTKIHYMANALSQNMEMMNVLQGST